jgi:hypothetical protein
MKTFKFINEQLHLQIYWPTIHINPGDGAWQVLVRAPTVFRFVKQKSYWGIGFEILGLGAAIDWEPKTLAPHGTKSSD